MAHCKNVRVSLLVPEGACNDRDKREAQSFNINVVEAKHRSIEAMNLLTGWVSHRKVTEWMLLLAMV